jgi:hypothetical protein
MAIEITNRQRYPVQLVVKSKLAPNTFTTKNIPGIGAKKNVYVMEDERHTIYVDRAEKMGLISTRYIPNSELNKGE